MKLSNWYVKSFLTGVISGLFSLLLYQSYHFGLFTFVLVTVLMVINNPKRRFMKAFWVVLSIFLALNKFSLWIAGAVFNVNFVFNSSILHWSVSIGLLILAAILLVLDYLERSNRKFSLFGFINITTNKINGNNNTTTITEGANVTYITVQGDYVVGDGKRQSINEIDEVKKFLKREEELQLLISSMSDDNQIKEYQNELAEIRSKAEETKNEIVNLSKTINLLSSRHPEEANKASELLLNGSYGSAKDYFMHLQEERQDKRLAEKLGIEYDELLQLDHWVEQGHTSSDGMIYYYNIWFNIESPKEIIVKIKGVEKLGDSYCLEVSPWFFDEPEDYYEEERDDEI